MANSIWRPISPLALTRRDVLAGSAALLAPLPMVGATPAKAAGPRGAMTLAWHTAMAPRWLDPRTMMVQRRPTISSWRCTMP